MRFRNSLLIKYLGFILLYIILVPFIGYLMFQFEPYVQKFLIAKTIKSPEYSSAMVEEEWKEEALQLALLSEEHKKIRLQDLYKKKYPTATIFWVDETGKTRLKLPETASIPTQWDMMSAVSFLKRSYGGDPYTVVGILHENAGTVKDVIDNDGFMVIQIPRELMRIHLPAHAQVLYAILYFGTFFLIFVAISWFFFYRIRKRLVGLQDAMQNVEDFGIPHSVSVNTKDEIGDLESSYNKMVAQLEQSREREREAEQLRRQLIANISHDIRTPLTTLRGHAYQIHQEEALSDKGKNSLIMIDDKIQYLDNLIDNLLAYTLLSAGSYAYSPGKVDVSRLLRSSIASWYPAFEREGFQIDIQIPEHSLQWFIDKQWFQRILDNLLQNVLRYAKSGQYVGISLEQLEDKMCIKIIDYGPGLNAAYASKGTGIGLTIVELMTKEMGLELTLESTEAGTIAQICSKYNPLG